MLDGYGDLLPSVNPTEGLDAWGFDTVNPDTSLTDDLFLNVVSYTTTCTCLALDKHGVTGTFTPGLGLLAGAATGLSVGANGTAWVIATNTVAGAKGSTAGRATTGSTLPAGG